MNYSVKQRLFNAELSRNSRHQNLLSIRESARFKRRSIVRGIEVVKEELNEEISKKDVVKNEDSKTISQPQNPRLERLLKFKEERKKRKEIEKKQKPAPFYAGAAKVPASVSGITRPRIQVPTSVSGITKPRSQIPTSVSGIAKSHNQTGSKENLKKIPVQPANSKKTQPTAIKSATLSREKLKTPLLPVCSGSKENSKKSQPTAIKSVPTQKDAFCKPNMQPGTSASKVTLSSVRSQPTAVATVARSKGLISKKIPQPQVSGSKIAVNSIKSQLKPAKYMPSSASNIFTAKNAKKSAEVKTTSANNKTEKGFQKSVEQVSDSLDVSELVHEKLEGLSMDLDVSEIKPRESFAPLNFKFVPPEGFYSIDVARQMNDFLNKLGCASRTSTPTRCSAGRLSANFKDQQNKNDVVPQNNHYLPKEDGNGSVHENVELECETNSEIASMLIKEPEIVNFFADETCDDLSNNMQENKDQGTRSLDVFEENQESGEKHSTASTGDKRTSVVPANSFSNAVSNLKSKRISRTSMMKEVSELGCIAEDVEGEAATPSSAKPCSSSKLLLNLNKRPVDYLKTIKSGLTPTPHSSIKEVPCDNEILEGAHKEMTDHEAPEHLDVNSASGSSGRIHSFDDHSEGDGLKTTATVTPVKMNAHKSGLSTEAIGGKDFAGTFTDSPRRSLRLSHRAPLSDNIGDGKLNKQRDEKLSHLTPSMDSDQNVTPRRSMRLLRKSIDSTPSSDANRDSIFCSEILDLSGCGATGITQELGRLQLASTDENIDPEILTDLTHCKKSKKISLLYTPAKRNSTRRSIKGDLITFSPST